MPLLSVDMMVIFGISIVADVTAPIGVRLICREPFTTEPEPCMLPPLSMTMLDFVWSTCAGMGMVSDNVLMSTVMAMPVGFAVSMASVTSSPEWSGSGLDVVVMAVEIGRVRPNTLHVRL